MEQMEQMIRMSVILEEIKKDVTEMSGKVDKIKDEHILQTTKALAIIETKLSRLENIIYGAITVVTIEFIGLLAMWIKE